MSRAGRDEDGQSALLAKYKSLCAKYDTLVRKFDRRTSVKRDLDGLARWAMSANGSGLALVDATTVLLATPRWIEIQGRQPDPRLWVNDDTGEPMGTLRALSIARAAKMLSNAEPLAELRLACPQEGTWLSTFFDRIESPHDRPLIAVLVHDATLRTQAEREYARTKESLLVRDRMRALGEISSGLAHDLHTTLRAALLRLEALELAKGRKEMADDLFAMRRILADAAELTGKVQRFGADGNYASEDIDLHAVVEETVGLVRELLSDGRRSGHRYVVRCPRKLPTVKGSRVDVKHVFLNLLWNARDAMPEGGTIEISLATADDRVIVEIADRGAGIPVADRARVFDAFFTSKARGGGSGFGLAFAQKIVSDAGGTIEALPRTSGGTILKMTLPKSPARPKSRARRSSVRDRS